MTKQFSYNQRKITSAKAAMPGRTEQIMEEPFNRRPFQKQKAVLHE
jgi:hypothetical protein